MRTMLLSLAASMWVGCSGDVTPTDAGGFDSALPAPAEPLRDTPRDVETCKPGMTAVADELRLGEQLEVCARGDCTGTVTDEDWFVTTVGAFRCIEAGVERDACAVRGSGVLTIRAAELGRGVVSVIDENGNVVRTSGERWVQPFSVRWQPMAAGDNVEFILRTRIREGESLAVSGPRIAPSSVRLRDEADAEVPGTTQAKLVVKASDLPTEIDLTYRNETVRCLIDGPEGSTTLVATFVGSIEAVAVDGEFEGTGVLALTRGGLPVRGSTVRLFAAEPGISASSALLTDSVGHLPFRYTARRHPFALYVQAADGSGSIVVEGP